MSITDMPADIPTTNALDDIEIEPTRAEVRLGSNTLLALDEPPGLGETRDIVLRLRCVRKGTELAGSDVEAQIIAFRAMKLVTAWCLGGPIPAEQPAMVDGEGNIDPEAMPEATDEDGEAPV